ncbi:MAG TPA: hypothetical protein PK812_12685, partial [Beijerinckiaceae bacterium]|nr:hypothetical protein [Beijerinckiaceae bacterium]
MHRPRSQAFRPKKTARWVAKALAPWSVASCLLISFTASAGPRIDAFDARRASIIDLASVTLPPRIAPGRETGPVVPGYSGLREAPLADVVRWLVPPSVGGL